MKLPIQWLREWANPKADDAMLAAKLTRAGLECEVLDAPPTLANIVVGEIRAIAPHPQADRLRVCQVDTGGKAPSTIVCGAANARVGMKAPVALPGAKLPDGTEIRTAPLRGVESAGMLCSAKELALAEKSDGLLELDASAKVGTPIGAHLRLADATLALELTPNRGDCLSILGLSREISAVFGVPHRRPTIAATKVTSKRRYPVALESRADCARYAGRAIERIDPAARTPDWMRERLRRAGIRCIHPVVDVTNYVLLELGQPMHAFDCAKFGAAIKVRRAKAGEALKLLNEQDYALEARDLLITDGDKPLALAGIMGGAASGVGAQTTDIFLESAVFRPELVAATGRRLRLPSDALYRFERGVDPTLQRVALERATQLILEICGGAAGPITEAGALTPKAVVVKLRRARLDQLLGYAIPSAEVEASLRRLGLGVKLLGKTGWQATIPGHRYDLRLEVDLIEEAARLYGYERIPARAYPALLVPAPVPEARPVDRARATLIARGYQEVVTYAFVDAGLQGQLAPDAKAIPLDNPIADTLAHMRTTLWVGLIQAWRYNQQRQQKRMRLFEVGVCFRDEGGAVVETACLAALAAGPAVPEQWGQPQRATDFFDFKADVEALAGAGADVSFQPGEHPALHPRQTARLVRGGRPVGWAGPLHPRLVAALDLPEAPFLLELESAALGPAAVPRPGQVSEFPASRRDLALVMKDDVAAATLLAQAREAAGGCLREAGVFDVYRGAGLPNGFKSVALSLIFQDNSRTLTDVEVDSAVQAVTRRLRESLGASIRGEISGGVDQGGTGRSAV
ncbi:MAG TPA: phenylalanine--tRNA ligase subunit beta [Verrucomicrobiae bacterium]|nr:phenylalanine--tRNA ligase subunit beta [Verrucomicrobiae bacterium]